MAATMKTIRNLIADWTESGTRKGPQFIAFCAKFRNAFTKELQSIGATDIVFNYGHYYISGFFTVGTKMYYFSIGDVRWFFSVSGCKYPLLYRTAQHYKDYTGGINQYVEIENGMAKKMQLER
jgi:hypothetical protein